MSCNGVKTKIFENPDLECFNYSLGVGSAYFIYVFLVKRCSLNSVLFFNLFARIYLRDLNEGLMLVLRSSCYLMFVDTLYQQHFIFHILLAHYCFVLAIKFTFLAKTNTLLVENLEEIVKYGQ